MTSQKQETPDLFTGSHSGEDPFSQINQPKTTPDQTPTVNEHPEMVNGASELFGSNSGDNDSSFFSSINTTTSIVPPNEEMTPTASDTLSFEQHQDSSTSFADKTAEQTTSEQYQQQQPAIISLTQPFDPNAQGSPNHSIQLEEHESNAYSEYDYVQQQQLEQDQTQWLQFDPNVHFYYDEQGGIHYYDPNTNQEYDMSQYGYDENGQYIYDSQYTESYAQEGYDPNALNVDATQQQQYDSTDNDPYSNFSNIQIQPHNAASDLTVSDAPAVFIMNENNGVEVEQGNQNPSENIATQHSNFENIADDDLSVGKTSHSKQEPSADNSLSQQEHLVPLSDNQQELSVEHIAKENQEEQKDDFIPHNTGAIEKTAYPQDQLPKEPITHQTELPESESAVEVDETATQDIQSVFCEEQSPYHTINAVVKLDEKEAQQNSNSQSTESETSAADKRKENERSLLERGPVINGENPEQDVTEVAESQEKKPDQLVEQGIEDKQQKPLLDQDETFAIEHIGTFEEEQAAKDRTHDQLDAHMVEQTEKNEGSEQIAHDVIQKEHNLEGYHDVQIHQEQAQQDKQNQRVNDIDAPAIIAFDNDNQQQVETNSYEPQYFSENARYEAQQDVTHQPQQGIGYVAQQDHSYGTEDDTSKEPEQNVSYEAQQDAGFASQENSSYEYQQTSGHDAQQASTYEFQQDLSFETQHFTGFEPNETQHTASLESQQAPVYEPQEITGFQLQQTGGYEPQQTGGYEPQQTGGYELQQTGGYEPQQIGSYEPENIGNYEPEQIGGHELQQTGSYEPQQTGNYEPQETDNHEHQRAVNYENQQNASYNSQESVSYELKQNSVPDTQQHGGHEPHQATSVSSGGYSASNYYAGYHQYDSIERSTTVPLPVTDRLSSPRPELLPCPDPLCEGENKIKAKFCCECGRPLAGVSRSTTPATSLSRTHSGVEGFSSVNPNSSQDKKNAFKESLARFVHSSVIIHQERDIAAKRQVALDYINSRTSTFEDSKAMLWNVVKLMLENPECTLGDGGKLDRSLINLICTKEDENVTITQLDELENILLEGDREKACEYAKEHDMWGHSLVIASSIQGGELYKSMITQFIQRHLFSSTTDLVPQVSRDNKTLRMLYSVFQGAGANSVAEFVKQAADEDPIYSEESLKGWKRALGMILANRTNDDQLVIHSLGDQLHQLVNKSNEARLCYLLSPDISGLDNNKLLGDDIFTELDELYLIEFYEFATKAIIQPDFKLILAWWLREFGFTEESQAYCDSIVNTISNNQETSVTLEGLKRIGDTANESEKVKFLLNKANFDTLIGSIEAKLQSTYSYHTTGYGYENSYTETAVASPFTNITQPIKSTHAQPISSPFGTQNSNSISPPFAQATDNDGGWWNSNAVAQEETTSYEPYQPDANTSQENAYQANGYQPDAFVPQHNSPSYQPSGYQPAAYVPQESTASYEPSNYQPAAYVDPVSNDDDDDLGFGNSKTRVNEPKVDKVMEEKVNEENTKSEQSEPDHKEKSSWGIFSIFNRNKDPNAEEKKPVKANLGESKNTFYYDEKEKRWINTLNDSKPAAATPPPPPKTVTPQPSPMAPMGTPTMSTPPVTGIPPPSRIDSAPTMGGPPVFSTPPASKRKGAGGKKPMRSRYVDVLNQN